MCRITLTTEGLAIAERIAHLQRYGGNLPAEFCEAGGCAVGLNRFTVTSADSPHGEFPLESERYWLAFNGEVFGFRDRAFVDEQQFESDGHFAMDVMLNHGIEVFLTDADLQGTFLIYDKETKEWWCAVDQMKVSGCFFAEWGDDNLIIASESAPINDVMGQLEVDAQVPIEVLAPGQAFVRNSSGQCRELNLRPQCENLFTNRDSSDQAFEEFYAAFSSSLTEAVRRRIPATGTVGVLCSGGVDSSIILAITAKFLRESDQLDRLKIFTLGAAEGEATDDNQDEIYTRLLLKGLDLDETKFLHVISAEKLEALNRKLYHEFVFSDLPRLIPPHPGLRSQVRGTIILSSMLCAIQQEHPDAITMLTGDGADELLAGYDEMIRGRMNAEEVSDEIVVRVNYFPLTEGARISLASFFGSSAAKWLADPADETTAPVEIRSPFTSHLFLESLAKGNADFLFGIIDDKRVNKLPIRLMCKDLGLPNEIVLREKMPFHEGATGEKVNGHSELEQSVVAEFMEKEGIAWNGPELNQTRSMFGYPADKPLSSSDVVPGNTDQVCVMYVSQGCGAGRLFMGSMFQQQPQPGRGTLYFPHKARHFDLY